MTSSASGKTDGAKGERVFGLDLLRAMAVMMALLAHALSYLRALSPKLQALSIGGFLGVEMFFVLSGFLIGGIILRSFADRPDLHTLKSFWVRRWFRTLPNYYLFLAVNLALAGGTGARGILGSYGLFLQNFAWPCPAFFAESWSLAVEEWFYLLFPVILFFVARARVEKRSTVTISLALLFLFSTILRVAIVAFEDPRWDAGIRKVVIYRFDALMIGVLAALIKEYEGSFWEKYRTVGIWAGAVFTGVVFWSYFGLNKDGSVFARTLLFPLTSLSVACFLPSLDAWRSANGTGALMVRKISLWSYSLYLCHLPVKHVLTRVFGDPEIPGGPTDAIPVFLLFITFVLASIGVSAMTHLLFERPAMDLREKFAAASSVRG